MTDKPGLTGAFRELALAITYDEDDDVVRIEFGKPIQWLAMPPAQAIGFARLILKHAAKKPID
jgi:hypothetical protein